MSELTFIDSSGLHAIARFALAQNGHGPVLIEGASPLIRRVFEITHLFDSPALDVRVQRDGG